MFSQELSYLHEQLSPRCQEGRVLLDSGAPRFDSASLIWQQEPLENRKRDVFFLFLDMY